MPTIIVDTSLNTVTTLVQLLRISPHSCRPMPRGWLALRPSNSDETSYWWSFSKILQTEKYNGFQVWA
ncbi:Hypothetical protein FKW44_017787 [Caligus rogercresseyi]|uniref:Uncharacterized protein n=1 Tax=Caligus rogercresseyi TaxID=217165 RepID=A0A7T8GTI6_CALRO|nr:Hypothetical protein FKW44_017787 [Caligus rogercresseyi]